MATLLTNLLLLLFLFNPLVWLYFMFRKNDFKRISKKSWSRLKITLFFILISFLLLITDSMITSSQKDLPTNQDPPLMSYDPQTSTSSAKTFNEMLGLGVEPNTDSDSWEGYKITSENEFIAMLEQHFRTKEEIDFRGVSYFNEAYKLSQSTNGEILTINESQRKTLDVAVGEDISSEFSHVVEKNINGGKIYFFFQNVFVDQLSVDWEKFEYLDLYAFMPYVDHYSKKVPILINGYENQKTNIPNSTYRKPSPDEKGYCFVSKNGSFEMTTKECADLRENMGGEQFVMKAFEYCLAGKNPQIGDSTNEEERKKPCMDMFEIVKNN